MPIILAHVSLRLFRFKLEIDIYRFEEAVCNLETLKTSAEQVHERFVEYASFKNDCYTNLITHTLATINTLIKKAEHYLEESEKKRLDLVKLSDDGPALVTILSYLDIEDKKNMRLVSKDWYTIVTEFDKSFRYIFSSLSNLHILCL